MRHILSFISITAVLLCCSCGGTSSPSVREEVVTAPSIIITPPSATVAAGGFQQFVASVQGIANTVVLWSIQEGTGGGTIDANGKYIAPMTSGTYHVIAQSQANPSVSASATVTVTVTIGTPGEAQGVYAGTYSFGMAFYAIVLPSDMFYSIEGSVAGDGAMTHVYRLASGQGKSNNGDYTAALNFFLDDGDFSSGLNATYVPATSLRGSISNATFSATALPPTQLDFNTPANLSHIAGSWTGIFLEDLLTGEPATGTVAIASSGQITSVGTGCSYSGMVTPVANKNFFNVTITFGPAPCALPNQTISGAAIEMLLPNGATRQLLIVMRQSTFGFAALR